jgi:hypothetical protein
MAEINLNTDVDGRVTMWVLGHEWADQYVIRDVERIEHVYVSAEPVRFCGVPNG